MTINQQTNDSFYIEKVEDEENKTQGFRVIRNNQIEYAATFESNDPVQAALRSREAFTHIGNYIISHYFPEYAIKPWQWPK